MFFWQFSSTALETHWLGTGEWGDCMSVWPPLQPHFASATDNITSLVNATGTSILAWTTSRLCQAPSSSPTTFFGLVLSNLDESWAITLATANLPRRRTAEITASSQNHPLFSSQYFVLQQNSCLYTVHNNKQIQASSNFHHHDVFYHRLCTPTIYCHRRRHGFQAGHLEIERRIALGQ